MMGFMGGRKDTWVHANPDPICECGDVATKYCKTEMKILSDAGIAFTSDGPRPGADGLIAFMNPRATGGVLLELVEREGG